MMGDFNTSSESCPMTSFHVSDIKSSSYNANVFLLLLLLSSSPSYEKFIYYFKHLYGSILVQN
jgi:hypothetical protein